jgi:hypothetical protein
VAFWEPRESPPELRRQLQLEGRFVVLYIGAHGISHALSRILETASMLRDTTGIQFLFVGEGAEKEKLIHSARDAGLENVRFLDPVDKVRVREFYALADVCLVPLRDIPLFDTFIPSKMFEMMAMARPIVASVRGESAEILRQSGGAVVVAPEDNAAVAAAIRELCRNPERGREMGRRAREFVAANYSRRALAADYAELLQSAMEEYRQTSASCGQGP